jgi:hypothetical protein
MPQPLILLFRSFSSPQAVEMTDIVGRQSQIEEGDQMYVYSIKKKKEEREKKEHKENKYTCMMRKQERSG